MNKPKKIPYGISDFNAIQLENYYYVDKTRFIETIEAAPKYLFLIRPRRFGKSLWLSVLHSYYDIAQKDDFDAVYGKTYIGQHPTGTQNCYLVLYLNFALVNPDINKVEESFESHCNMRYDAFNNIYRSYFDDEYFEGFSKIKASYDRLEYIYIECQQRGLNIFMIIDEYDNFANTILSLPEIGQVEYQKLTHADGAFRHFFNKLKGGTTGSNAAISRLFITGVSPLTMDDVTSGFNIGTNITTTSRFNEMVGFTESEVVEMFVYYKSTGLIETDYNRHLAVMREWYNNYRFSDDTDEVVYNSDMVLYYIEHLLSERKPPKRFIDRNVRMDYKKLRYLVTLDKKLNGNFSKLKELIENGEITAYLHDSFQVHELTDTDKFVSLLYYFGLITIVAEKEGNHLFKIPNETIKTFNSEYIREAYRDTNTFEIKADKLGKLIHEMAYRGAWKDVMVYLTEQIKEQTSIRDYIQGEIMMKGFLLVYLNLTDHFYVHSEQEMNKGFADLYLEPFLAHHTEMKYAYLIELKYMHRDSKKEPSANNIKTLCNEAENQLNQYKKDPYIVKTKGKTKLIKIVLVYHGWELIKYYEMI